MATGLRRRLAGGEVIGSLILVAGLIVFAARDLFSDPWVMTGALLMVVGSATAARARALAERGPSTTAAV